MRQFDVFENPSGKTRAAIPLLLILQHDRASDTESVVVAGLAPLAKAKGLAKSRLYPILRITGRDYVLLTPNLAAVSRKQLDNLIATVGSEDRRIIDAVDMLFTGI